MLLLNVMALTGLGVASLLLVWSGARHASETARFRAALVAHRVVPYRWTRFWARGVLGLELVLGLLGVGAVLAGAAIEVLAVRVVAGAVGTCYVLFAGYTVAQLRRSPHAACGCFGDDAPATGATVARAAVLAAAAVTTVLAVGPPVGLGEVGLAVVAAIPLGILVRHLPLVVGPRKVVGVA